MAKSNVVFAEDVEKGDFIDISRVVDASDLNIGADFDTYAQVTDAPMDVDRWHVDVPTDKGTFTLTRETTFPFGGSM